MSGQQSDNDCYEFHHAADGLGRAAGDASSARPVVAQPPAATCGGLPRQIVMEENITLSRDFHILCEISDKENPHEDTITLIGVRDNDENGATVFPANRLLAVSPLLRSILSPLCPFEKKDIKVFMPDIPAPTIPIFKDLIMSGKTRKLFLDEIKKIRNDMLVLMKILEIDDPEPEIRIKEEWLEECENYYAEATELEQDVDCIGTNSETDQEFDKCGKELISNSVEDFMKHKCKECGQIVEKSKMRFHTEKEHAINIKNYKKKHGNLNVEMNVWHKCGICQKFLKHNRDDVLNHINKHHNITMSNYTTRFLSGKEKNNETINIVEAAATKIGKDEFQLKNEVVKDKDEEAFSLNNPGSKVHHGDKCIQNKSLKLSETNEEGEKSASDSDPEGNLLSNDKADYVMVSYSSSYYLM